MYISTIGPSTCGSLEKFLIGTSERAKTRITTLGEFRGVHIAIDSFRDSLNQIIQKRYVLWNNDTQLVWYKNRKANGKFELLA